ncbi:MAG TPA: hypothetical protein DDX98_12650 [Bacteroidales bacterium]|nr:hypothetical protein [Bacteroidales bacterium]
MKKYLLCLVLIGLASTTFSQDPITYNIEGYYTYEVEFDNKVYSEKKPKLSLAIYKDSIVTTSDGDIITEQIIEIKKTEEGFTVYKVKNPELGLIWITIEDDLIKMKIDIDRKMLYVYKILNVI